MVDDDYRFSPPRVANMERLHRTLMLAAGVPIVPPRSAPPTPSGRPEQHAIFQLAAATAVPSLPPRDAPQPRSDRRQQRGAHTPRRGDRLGAKTRRGKSR